ERTGGQEQAEVLGQRAQARRLRAEADPDGLRRQRGQREDDEVHGPHVEQQVTYLESEPVEAEPMPQELSRSRVRRSLLVLAVVAIVVVALLTLVPGLASLREAFKGAKPGWLVVAGCLEVLSCLSYVLVFRAVFCQRMSWRTSAEIGLSEQAANCLLNVG